MSHEEFNANIWDYYLMLEAEFIETFKYVEPVKNGDGNEKVYSKKYIELLLSICSQVDLVSKELCKKIEMKTDNDVKDYTIGNYKAVFSNYKDICNQECLFIKIKEIIKPWDNWCSIDCPEWWTVHNKLKHKRMLDDNYKLGNFKYVKDSLAGLYVLSRILHNEYFDYEPYNKSKIFKMVNWPEYGMVNEDEYLYYDD